MAAHEYQTLQFSDAILCDEESHCNTIIFRRGIPIGEMIGVIFKRKNRKTGVATQYPEILLDASEIAALHELIVTHMAEEAEVANADA